MSRVADRAEAGLHKALRLTGCAVTLRRRSLASGTFDPATGLVAAPAAVERQVPAILMDEKVTTPAGALARRSVALVPARLIPRYFGALPWGMFDWEGPTPLVPQPGDQVLREGEPARTIPPDGVEVLQVAGRIIGWRATLEASA